jgi:fucose permease
VTPRPRLLARLGGGVLALQLAMFVALGLPEGALGVAWPPMRGSLDRPLGDLGLVLAAGTVGYLAGSTGMARAIRGFGTAYVMVGSMAIATAALAVWTAAPWWPLVLVAAAGLGLSRGLTDAGLNAYVALHGGVRQLGLLHGCFGVGSTIGPLLVVLSRDLTGTWRTAFAVLAVVHGALGVWAWEIRARWEPDVEPVVHADEGAAPPMPWLRVVLTLAVFASLVGAEGSVGAWSYTLLTDGRGIGQTAAGLAVATFWGALTVGRFVMAAYGHRVQRTTLVRASCLVALAGVALLAWNPAGLGVIGLPIAGLGFASIFPALVALTPDRIGARRSATVIGWSIAAASLGGTAVAALAGLLADHRGADALGPALLAATVALVVLEAVLARVAPVRDRRPAER